MLLVLVGVLLGLGASRLGARPAPTPSVTSFATAAPSPSGTSVPLAAPSPSGTSVPLAAPSPSADTETLVFAQPLSAGCATDAGVWVVADGGGVARFADGRWSLIDPTLRSLVAVACTAGEAVAVGPAGRVLTADDLARTITVDAAGPADLTAIAALPDGSALAVGAAGTVLRRSGGWQPFARGIEEDLLGVSFAGRASAWAVGIEGAAYRLEEPGWHALPTGLGLTLRAVSAGPELAVAVGDDGALLRWRGGWTRFASGTAATLRAVVLAGTVAWAAGDAGTALRMDLETERAERIDLGTSCTVRSVFLRGSEVWFVASAGTRAAVWRRDAGGLRRWGVC
ncbi:MAG: hypothetical protein Q7S25_01380 [Candidatus Limnocylindria bacterium]|nr:hypothetical protein [Candidatus Limnocylindria bacterium]